MEILLVRAIIFDFENPKDVLETLHGFKPWNEEKKFETGVNVIVADPIARTLHVVVFSEVEANCEIFDFTGKEPGYHKGRSPYGIVTSQSLFKVAD